MRHARPGSPEEHTAERSGLGVLLDGVMELRFCGARVQLGPLMT
jgi:hypothetical protein